MNETISQFISHARQKGLDHGTIRQLLLSAGWKDKEIARAIASQGLDLPVPEPGGGGNVRDSFIYLLCFAALYGVVGSVIAVYFVYLDYLFPDPTDVIPWEWALSGIRYALAVIVIAFPLFLLLNRVIEHLVHKAPESSKQPIARWLTYLTMFLAAAVGVGDLIALLYFFLDGALQARFVLKAAALLVIAQLILSYYYLAPRETADATTGKSLRPWLGGAGVAVVLGAVALGFMLAGSPFSARLRRMDERRLDDLKAIHQAMQQMTTRRDQNVWVVTRSLPTKLEEVAEFQRTRQYGRALSLTDPETNEPYGFRVTGETTYELCAQFEVLRDVTHELFWNHPVGKHCFAFNVTSPP